MALFDSKVQNQLKDIFKVMENQVTIAYGTQEMECGSCKETREFVEEISSLNSKINVEIYDFQKDADKIKELGIDKIPAIVLLDSNGKDQGVRFYGLPGGYEINSFVSSILETSGKKDELPPELLSRIQKINKAVHIQVFVSLSCPYCPAAVSAAHRLALENDHIVADMVETATFPHLAVKYQVQGVPRIVINETEHLEGAHPIANIVEAIEKL